VHGMLKLYYGLNEEGKAPEQPLSLDPCDINGPHFDPELYLNKVLSFLTVDTFVCDIKRSVCIINSKMNQFSSRWHYIFKETIVDDDILLVIFKGGCDLFFS